MSRRGPVLAPAAVARLDRLAWERYRIPTLLLMERAGQAVAGEVLGILGRRRSQRVVCVCGKGNNGGDGFVAARYLKQAGVPVEVYFTGTARDLKGDAQLNYRILVRLGIVLRPLRGAKDRERLRRSLRAAEVVVDALLGIGAQGAAREPLARVIRLLNASGAWIVAADVPSGLDAATGACAGEVVQACRTVTFTALKTGLVSAAGRRKAGRIRVADIGIPFSEIRNQKAEGRRQKKP
ncbi:MAG: NAD(P)H-hydrate epimerase [Deltaproteobacteria bacterium]